MAQKFDFKFLSADEVGAILDMINFSNAVPKNEETRFLIREFTDELRRVGYRFHEESRRAEEDGIPF